MRSARLVTQICSVVAVVATVQSLLFLTLLVEHWRAFDQDFVPLWSRVLVAAAFVLGGLVLLTRKREVRAATLATLSLVTVSSYALSPLLRAEGALHQFFGGLALDALLPWLLWRLLSEVPRALRTGRGLRAGRTADWALLAGGLLLLVINFVTDSAHPLSRAQPAGLYWLLVYLPTLLILFFALIRTQQTTREESRRFRLLLASVVGPGCALCLLVVATTLPGLDTAVRAGLFETHLITLLLLLIPIGSSYALLVDEPLALRDTLRLAIRRCLDILQRSLVGDHRPVVEVLANVGLALQQEASAAGQTRAALDRLAADMRFQRIDILVPGESGFSSVEGEFVPLDRNGVASRWLSAQEPVALRTALADVEDRPAHRWLQERRYAHAIALDGRRTPGLLLAGHKLSGAEPRASELDVLRLGGEQILARQAMELGSTSAFAGLCPVCDAVYEYQRQCADCEHPTVPLPIPFVLGGKYRLLRRIGPRSDIHLLLARDRALDRLVVLKVLPQLGGAAIAALRREARACAAISHPGLAEIHALEVFQQTPVLVFEYLAGGTLAERLGQGALPLATLLPMARQVALALVHLHDNGLLHRDIKPANLGFTATGDSKLLDFGAVELFVDSDTPSERAGSLPYMSPEAIRAADAQPAMDIWSFAVTFLECLTGRNPFAASTEQETVRRIIGCRDPAQLVAVDSEFARLLVSCLDRSTGHAPQTASELLASIENLHDATLGKGVARGLELPHLGDSAVGGLG